MVVCKGEEHANPHRINIWNRYSFHMHKEIQYKRRMAGECLNCNITECKCVVQISTGLSRRMFVWHLGQQFSFHLNNWQCCCIVPVNTYITLHFSGRPFCKHWLWKLLVFVRDLVHFVISIYVISVGVMASILDLYVRYIGFDHWLCYHANMIITKSAWSGLQIKEGKMGTGSVQTNLQRTGLHWPGDCTL